jgi:hypothetical protein
MRARNREVADGAKIKFDNKGRKAPEAILETSVCLLNKRDWLKKGKVMNCLMHSKIIVTERKPVVYSTTNIIVVRVVIIARARV